MVLVLVLILKKKSWSWSCPKSLDIFKTLMNDNTNRIISIHISLPTVVASYLAFIQLILDETEAGILCHLVRDNKQFACLKPLLESESESVFVHRAHQHQSNEFSAMEVCFADLTEQ